MHMHMHMHMHSGAPLLHWITPPTPLCRQEQRGDDERPFTSLTPSYIPLQPLTAPYIPLQEQRGDDDVEVQYKLLCFSTPQAGSG